MIRVSVSVLPADCAAAMIYMSISVIPAEFALALRVRIAGHNAGVSLALFDWAAYWRSLGDGEFMAALGPVAIHAFYDDDQAGSGA
jgi:hypothetical protein